MKIAVWIVLAILVIMVPIVLFSDSIQPIENSIVTMVKGSNLDRDAASGFVIGSSNGSYYVVTNYRINNDNKSKVYLWRSNDEIYTAVEALDLREYGVMVMRIIGKPKGLKSITVNAKASILPGNNATILGYYGDRYLDSNETFSYKIDRKDIVIQDVDIVEGIKLYMYNGDYSRRMEGGPLVDSSGRVIGVNAYINDYDYDYGAVNINQILPYIKGAGIPLKTGLSRKSIYLLILVFLIVLIGLMQLYMITRSSNFLLVGVSGFYVNKSIPLNNKRIAIGRDPTQCQLIFPPETKGISRKHCEIYYDKQIKRHVIVDSSSQGTFMQNGEILQKGKPYVLGDGMRFYLAKPQEQFQITKKKIIF